MAVVPQTPPIVFGPRGSISTEHEWLVTDGLGGYASGTVSGLRTRRQHALLTVGGHVGLVTLDLTVTLPSGAKVPLYTHAWSSGAVSPAGHLHLERFALIDGLPRWRWRVGDVVVERELAMGPSAVHVRHRVVSAPGPVGLAVAAMCTWRESDGTRHSTDPVLKLEQVAGGVVVEDAYRISGPGWQPGGEWHLDARTDQAEDLWMAGTFVQRLDSGESFEISAWAGDLASVPTATVVQEDPFVIDTPDGPDVVAGYPAAASRLADTAIAYEGLFLTGGRADLGRELLIAQTVKALRGRPADESPAAPLWLVHAVDRHVARTGDTDLAAELAVPLSRLLRQRFAGDGPLLLDDDELLRLSTGERIGKAVEINALWVNALAALGDLLEAARRDPSEPRGRHDRARAEFAAKFPAADGWLHDVIEGPPATYPLGGGVSHDDPTLRAGQILAWSLPHAPLAPDASALRAIGPSLLTPLGLRTLSPSEYGYQPATIADGAVRPWLIGPWVDACVAAGLPVEGLLTGLEAHLGEYGLGSVSEWAGGDAPHPAGGNPFSARSVAEFLRVQGVCA